MSLAHGHRGPGRIDIAIDWLRDARAALTHPVQKISGLSDADLRDIGLRPRSLTTTVYREIGRPGLVDFGWRLGR